MTPAVPGEAPCARCLAAEARAAAWAARAAGLEEALAWIAQQFCARAPDADANLRVCPESGDCLTEWCLACYARAALARAPAKCAACRGRGCTEGSTRHASDDHDHCPACSGSGTGRATGEEARSVLAALWLHRDIADPEWAALTRMPSVMESAHDAVAAALAKLAALAPPAAEGEALLLCRKAVEAREAWMSHRGDGLDGYGGRLEQEQREAHAAAAAALRALYREEG